MINNASPIKDSDEQVEGSSLSDKKSKNTAVLLPSPFGALPAKSIASSNPFAFSPISSKAPSLFGVNTTKAIETEESDGNVSLDTAEQEERAEEEDSARHAFKELSKIAASIGVRGFSFEGKPNQTATTTESSTSSTRVGGFSFEGKPNQTATATESSSSSTGVGGFSSFEGESNPTLASLTKPVASSSTFAALPPMSTKAPSLFAKTSSSTFAALPPMSTKAPSLFGTKTLKAEKGFDDETTGSDIHSNGFLPKLTDSKGTVSKDNAAKLRWLKSPEEGNFSDWKLDVKQTTYDEDPIMDGSIQVTTDTIITSYLVHRCVVVLKSEYFNRLFLETHEKGYTIELPAPITLDHFETLLDYFYWGGIELNFSNAIPIFYLSNHLQMQQLSDHAMDHISKRIGKCTGEKLFACNETASKLQIEKLKNAIAHVCAQRPDLMGEGTRLTKTPNNEFWYDVWEARNHYKDQLAGEFSKQWSENLANYMDQHHGSIVDHKKFYSLTNTNSLPNISPVAAISLMEQEQKICPKDARDVDDLTCLQRRSIDSLYDKKTGLWNISNKNPELRQMLRRRLKSLPSAVLCSLLEQTMEYEGSQFGKLSIEVYGAGLECVNGRYDLCSEVFGGKPIFTRFDFRLQQQMMIVCCNRSDFSMFSQENCFYICAVPRGKMPDTFGTKELYRRQVGLLHTFLPPGHGWEAVRPAGVNPPPSLIITKR